MALLPSTRLARYGFAVVSALVCVLARVLLTPLLGSAIPYVTLFLGVTVAAWFGGLGPGLLSALLGVLAVHWLVVPPVGSPELPGGADRIALVMYMIVSTVTALFGNAFRKANARSHVEAEKAIAEREKLRTTLASIGDAVLVTDENLRIRSINPVAEALTGWRSEDAVGEPLDKVFRIVNERTRQPVENPAIRVIREGTIVGLANHTVLVGRNGLETPIDDSAAPIRDSEGRVSGVVLVFRDVTLRRRASDAAVHLAAIVQSSDDAILSKDLDGTIRSWNASAERLYGYAPAETIGRHVSMIVPPERRAELATLMEKLRRGEPTSHFETQRLTRDGRLVDVSVNVSPIRNAEGEVVGASTMARDISLRKRAEQERKRTEESLRFLAEASSALSAVVDYESTLQEVARIAVPRFADFCCIDLLEGDGELRRLAVTHRDPDLAGVAWELARRYPPEKTAAYGSGRVLATGKSELLREVPDALLEELARDTEHLRLLKTLGFKAGIKVPLSVRGRMIGVLSFGLVDTHRHYDTHNLAVAEDLAHRAAIAIDNAMLYAEIRKADRLKTEFLAILAHELRNPLAPIRNALHILQMPGVEPDAAGQARDIAERQVHQLTHLVDDLLDVSRIMRGAIALRPETLLLSTVIERAIETALPSIDAGRHRFTTRLPDEPVHVRGDIVRLSQAVANLLNNAAKYTETGGEIHLEAKVDGPEVAIAIRDTGIGIDPEVLPDVFDLFVQGDPTADRSQGGMGIGLTLVRRLVEMHGGTVRAKSAGPGQGSEFTIHLPVVSPTGDNGPGGRGEGREATVRRGARKILVVDDNVDAADSVAMLLRLEGEDVELAYDGFQALEIVRRTKPDIVFLDIGMPRLDGIEVARRIRQAGNGRRILLVAMTGWGQDEDRRRTTDAGFNYHLVKPVEPETLRSVIGALEHDGRVVL